MSTTNYQLTGARAARDDGWSDVVIIYLMIPSGLRFAIYFNFAASLKWFKAPVSGFLPQIIGFESIVVFSWVYFGA